MPMSRPGPASAFTLMELLIVVAIIGLLAAMIMPAVTMVKASAVKLECASNLRQVGLAYGSYVNNFDGYLPDSNNGTYNNCYIAPTLTDPYLDRTSKAWRCPAMLRRLPKPTAWYGDAVFYHNWHIPNRDVQPFGNNDATPVTSRMPVTMQRIVYLSEAMVLADMNGGSSSGYHNNRANMLMADLSWREVVDDSQVIGTAAHAFSATNPRSVYGGWMAQRTANNIRGFSYRP